MSCPTCDHTMQGVGHDIFHCPRCGTMKGGHADGSFSVPALVSRCREYGKTLPGKCAYHTHEFVTAGIYEAIDLPGQRGPK